MAYIILTKHISDIPNMYRIAKDKTDLDQLNIIKTDYNIVE
jgi:hypothetical protein